MTNTPEEQQPNCDNCVFVVYAKGIIDSQRQANSAAAAAVRRVEDANVAARKNGGLHELGTDLELQKILCQSNGEPAGCLVARFCIEQLVQVVQRAPFRS